MLSNKYLKDVVISHVPIPFTAQYSLQLSFTAFLIYECPFELIIIGSLSYAPGFVYLLFVVTFPEQRAALEQTRSRTFWIYHLQSPYYRWSLGGYCCSSCWQLLFLSFSVFDCSHVLGYHWLYHETKTYCGLMFYFIQSFALFISANF